MGLGDNERAESNVVIVRLRELAQPENYATLPLLDLAGAKFHWRAGYIWAFYGFYLDLPVFFQLVPRTAVLSEPSVAERRFLVIELTNDQFDQASKLNESAMRERESFYVRLAENQMRYSGAVELRTQMRHLGEHLGRQYRANRVLGWIDGCPKLPDPRTLW